LRELRAEAERDVAEIVEDVGVCDETVISPTTETTPSVPIAERRRVRRKAPFRSYLLSCAKAKFGCPTDNTANRLCVRKYLVDLCHNHGVIARHTAENVDIVAEMVFVPTRAELVAAAARRTSYTSKQSVLGSLLGLKKGPTTP
jgi:hypothetical protein